MSPILQHIEYLKAETSSEHPFFGQLEAESDRERVQSLVPLLTFWILTFQDLAKINTTFARDAPFREVIQREYEEDRGQDKWFLRDLERVTGEIPGVDAIFAPRFQQIRWMSYKMINLAFSLRTNE